MNRTSETYYSGFHPTFTVIIGWSLPLIVCVLVVLHGWPLDPVGLLIGLPAGAITGLLLTLLAIYLYPVYVEPAGIRSYNFWGLYRTTAWSRIESVGRFNLLGLRYLSVRSPGSDTIYVPLFLSRMQQFRESVRSYAGENSVLVQELDRG